MFDVLFDYIETNSGTILTDDERTMIQSKFYPKRLLKRQYFLQEGDICKKIAFIVKGAARMYSIDERGHEHIVRFGLESWWLADQESLNLLTPTRYHIEMLEDCDLLVIGTDNAHELRDLVRGFDLAIKTIDRQSLIASQKRIHAAISMTAEERYDDLIRNYPQFLQRFPQNMIASYLGISPETLCRMRRNTSKI
jgi:CRP-like cAMP-binding protein